MFNKKNLPRADKVLTLLFSLGIGTLYQNNTFAANCKAGFTPANVEQVLMSKNVKVPNNTPGTKINMPVCCPSLTNMKLLAPYIEKEINKEQKDQSLSQSEKNDTHPWAASIFLAKKNLRGGFSNNEFLHKIVCFSGHGKLVLVDGQGEFSGEHDSELDY